MLAALSWEWQAVDEHFMPTIRHFMATDPSALSEISSRVHDAFFDVVQVEFDRETGTVVIPLEQEPVDDHPASPRPQLSRSTWRYDEFSMPYLRCVLRVRSAVALRMPEDAVELSMLLGVHNDVAGTVRVQVDTTDWIEIDVDTLHVELDVTDEVVTVRRRRVGRLIPWDSTSDAPS